MGLVKGAYFGELAITFIIRSSDHKQKLRVEAGGAKIEKMYENLELDLDLKLLFLLFKTSRYYLRNKSQGL